MSYLLKTVIVVALALPALTSTIGAQGLDGSARVIVGFPSVNREILTSVDRLTGTVFGLEAGVHLWRAELRARYLQGSVESSTSTAQSDLVQGALSLQVRLIDYLVLGLGPEARSYVAEGGTERWLTWVGRLTVDTWLLRSTLRSSLSLSYALSGDVNTGSDFSQGRSLEGWLHAHIPRLPVSVALGYRVEYGSLRAGAGSDTLEEFLLGVGVGR